MPEYVSIRDDVVKKLEVNLPEIRERFGIETLGLFGSVSRGEDTAESDIDI
ncbi:nucleotidyltransferase domain-containing protein, partial [Methanocorpusculum sp.]|nr:nucleotidyltransferase domain-containing protein [Methanocorpusculum sp.]